MKWAAMFIWALLLLAALIRGHDIEGRDAHLRLRIDSLEHHMARVDTIRIVDSVRVVRTVHALDTVRHTVLEHLTDTVAVKEYVYKTDTLRTACLACVASAARLSTTNDSLRRAYANLVQSLDAQKPHRWQRYLPVATGVAGFLLGAKLRP